MEETKLTRACLAAKLRCPLVLFVVYFFLVGYCMQAGHALGSLSKRTSHTRYEFRCINYIYHRHNKLHFRRKRN